MSDNIENWALTLVFAAAVVVCYLDMFVWRPG